MPLWPFHPKSPIDAEAQAWVNQRMKWLADQFGMPVWRLGRAVVPTDEFFPDPYDRSTTALQNMLNRICARMAVDPKRIDLRIYSDERNRPVGRGTRLESDEPGTAGHYRVEEKEIVAIEASNLADPGRVVAIMAHELAHVRLIGEKRLTGEEEDHERLTDLATVFFGLGIFNANSTFEFSQWTRGGWQGWKASRIGYLDEMTYGYALALWTMIREDHRPHWMRYLKASPRTYMKQSIGYLKQHPPRGFNE